MNTATQPSTDLQPPPASPDREQVMDRLWQRMAQVFGVERWASARGPVGGEEYADWTAGLADYSVEQVTRGVRALSSWRGSEPPTLEQFSRLCLTPARAEASAAHSEAASAPPQSERNSEVARREQQRQARIATSPKDRRPTPGDVESFEQSYHLCGLGSRWPGGKVAGVS